MSVWKKNKARAVTWDDTPTLTDQAGANDTDINVIVGQFLVHGQVPGGAKKPIYGEDYTQLPNDLRGFIEMGRTLKEHRDRLPKELQGMPLTELLALTPEQLTAKLTPPQQEAKKEEPK